MEWKICLWSSTRRWDNKLERKKNVYLKIKEKLSKCDEKRTSLVKQPDDMVEQCVRSKPWIVMSSSAPSFSFSSSSFVVFSSPASDGDDDEDVGMMMIMEIMIIDDDNSCLLSSSSRLLPSPPSLLLSSSSPVLILLNWNTHGSSKCPKVGVSVSHLLFLPSALLSPARCSSSRCLLSPGQDGQEEDGDEFDTACVTVFLYDELDRFCVCVCVSVCNEKVPL